MNVGNGVQAMGDAVKNLIETCPEESKESMKQEMSEFLKLFKRYVHHQHHKQEDVLQWDKIQRPSEKIVKPYENLETVQDEKRVRELLQQVVVLKLNGGLGTTMGCKGPKSVIEVTNSLTFLDLVVNQIKYLNKRFDVDVPLVLMNSFNTNSDTEKIIKKYATENITILTFHQKQFPRIFKDTLLPVPKSADPSQIDVEEWYPPGHGDVFDSLYRSPLFEKFKKQGKKYLFMSNVDNLGATVDLNILNHLEKNGIEYCMEVTQKTRADVKGGTLIGYEGKVKLLEIASVPKEHVEEFKSIKKFKIFNTNNLWIHLPSMEQHLNDLQNVEIIVNQKLLKGQNILQLETAAGAAIQLFDHALGICVDRSRFLPVKSCSDLLMIQSNLYTLDSKTNNLVMNKKRAEKVGEAVAPMIKLGTEFTKVQDFQSRFESIPDILELESLTVQGDVRFGKSVSLRGHVIVIAAPGSRIDIPSGSILENKAVTGNLRIYDN